MTKFYAREQVLDAKGKPVAYLGTPVCRSIAVLGEKLLQKRKTFPIEEGQRFAGRIYVYRTKMYSAAAHGVYEIVNGKLKRLSNSQVMNSFIDPETSDRDHTYPSVITNYQEEVDA